MKKNSTHGADVKHPWLLYQSTGKHLVGRLAQPSLDEMAAAQVGRAVWRRVKVPSIRACRIDPAQPQAGLNLPGGESAGRKLV
jgi:hypothetical protein